MTNLRASLLLAFASSAVAYGQGIAIHDNVTTAAKNVPQGAQAPVYTVPYARVTVCDATCSTTVPIYQDEAMTQPITQPLIADAQGRFTYYIPPGFYYEQLASPGGETIATVPVDPQGAACTGSSACSFPRGFTTSTIAPLTNTFYQPDQILQNMSTAQMQAAQGATVSDGLSIGQNIPGGTVGQVNGVGVYQVSSGNINAGGGAVGYYARAIAASAGQIFWGGNYNLDDKGNANTTFYGLELDANVSSASTGGSMLFGGAIFNVQSNVGFINLPLPASYSGHYWSYALATGDGATGPNAISLGAVHPSVAQVGSTYGTVSSDAQNIQFIYRDSTGNSHVAQIVVDSAGVMHLPNNGVVIPTGDMNVMLGAVKAGVAVLYGMPGSVSSPYSDGYSSGGTIPDTRIQTVGGTKNGTYTGALQFIAQSALLPVNTTLGAPGVSSVPICLQNGTNCPTSMGGAALATPASSSAPCTVPEIEYDSSFIYTCVATNTWRRAALSTF